MVIFNSLDSTVVGSLRIDSIEMRFEGLIYSSVGFSLALKVESLEKQDFSRFEIIHFTLHECMLI